MSFRTLLAAFLVSSCALWPAAAARARDVDEALARAQALYEQFDLDGMKAELDQAQQGIEQLPEEQRGGPALQRLWLLAQAAIVMGEAAEANRWLVEIITLAPWWGAPRGYLTPELDATLQRRRDDLLQRTGTLNLTVWPADSALTVDGIEAPCGGGIPVLAGRHHVVIDVGDGEPVALWVDVTTGQIVAVAEPAGRTPGADVSAEPDGRTPDADVSAEPDGRTPDADVSAEPAGRTPDADVSAGPDGRTPDADVSAGPDGRTPDADVSAEPAGRTPDADVSAGPDGRTPDATAPAPDPVASSGPRPTAGLFRLVVGGGGRLVLPADTSIAGGGGPALEIGGGAVFGGHLQLLGTLGIDAHGPAPLPADETQPTLDGTQRGYELRLGVMVGPRLGGGGATGTTVTLAAGGGVAVCGLSTSLRDVADHASTGVGAYLTGTVALEQRFTPGLAVGPTVSYVHGFVGQSGQVTTALLQVDYQTSAVRLVEVGLLLTATGAP